MVRRSTKNDVTVRKADDELPKHCTQTDEEAGSIVFHVDNDKNGKDMTDSVSGAFCYEEEITMACKREEANEAAAAKKTLESNDAVSKEDEKIRRLIEERRSTSKGEKQRLKFLSKPIEMHHGQEKSKQKQEEVQRILEDFKGIRNIPGIKSARRRVFITKVKNEKGEVITSRKGIADVFGDSTKTIR